MNSNSTDLSPIILTEKYPIINNLFILTKIRTQPATQTATQTATQIYADYIKNNFCELIYSGITKTINEFLTESNIIRMPIIYHNNIYIFEHITECPINNINLPNLKHHEAELYVKYDPYVSDSLRYIITSNSQNLTRAYDFSKINILNADTINPTICNFIHNKTQDIITALNYKLNKHNITIKRANIGFSIRNGYKETTRSHQPDSKRLLDIIFLKPTTRIFEIFEFMYTESLTAPPTTATATITDPYIIYNALTDNKPIEIESYKTIEEITKEFKDKISY